MKKSWQLIGRVGLVIWILILIYGVFFNISYIDEAKYLIKGWLMLTKQIGYYSTEEFFYQHMPGGFLWYGLGQLVWGANLLIARVQSMILGLLVAVFSYKLVKLISGRQAGYLMLGLLSLSPILGFNYASVVPYSLISLILLIGFNNLYQGLVLNKTNRVYWASFWFSLSLVIRENFLFYLGLYGLFLLLTYVNQKKVLLKNFLIMGLTWGIFLWPGYPGIFKVFKNFPGINNLPIINPTEREILSLSWQRDQHNLNLFLQAFFELGTAYYIWVLGLILVVVMLLKKKALMIKVIGEGKRRLFFWFLIISTFTNWLVHVWGVFQLSPRAVVAYFSYTAPFLGVILICFLTEWAKQIPKKIWLIYFCLLLLVPLNMKIGSIYGAPDKQAHLFWINRSVNEIKPVVEDKEKIIWLSEPMVLYLTGKTAYYPLINHSNFYKPSTKTKAVKSLGFWNKAMMNDWLLEADLLVIDQNKMRGLSKNNRTIPLVSLLNQVIETDFEEIKVEKDIWPGKLKFYQPLNR